MDPGVSCLSSKTRKEHEEWLKSKAKFATETKPLNKRKTAGCDWY